MSLNFLQSLWPPNFVPDRKQDVKIETMSIPRPQNNGDRELMESDRVHQAGSGIWENIWRINLPWNNKSEEQVKKSNVNGVVKLETVLFPRAENRGDPEQMERGKVHQARSGIWENIWKMNPPWSGQCEEQAKKAKSNEAVRIETVHIPRTENSGDCEQMKSRKVHQAGLGMWENMFRMNLPWDVKSNEQAKKSNRNGVVKIETVQIPRPENSGNCEQMGSRKVHQAGLGIWENIWQMNLPWNGQSEEQAKQANVNEAVKIEKVHIPKPGNIGDCGQMKSRKVHQAGLGIWENIWQMNLPWNATSEKQASKENVNEAAKIETINTPRPENNGGCEEMESSKVHKTGLGNWENSWGMSFPWNAKSEEQAKKANVNEVAMVESGCAIPSFTPYMAKIPWHTGARAFLSQLFPRYGNYCGPNWSSGKDRGALLWDKRPIDQLDFCCYWHDIGYDTHDQAEMLKADIAFLDCLERTRVNPKGNPRVAEAYKAMCIAGLRNVLIPYRKQLLKQIHRGKTPATTVNRWNGRDDTVQWQIIQGRHCSYGSHHFGLHTTSFWSNI